MIAKIKLIFSLLTLIILNVTLLNAQSFTKINHAYWYQPQSSIEFHHQLWQNNDKLNMIFSLSLKDTAWVGAFDILVHERKQLSDSVSLKIEKIIKPEWQDSQNNRYFFSYVVKDTTNINFLLVQAQNKLNPTQNYWFYSDLRLKNRYPAPKFIIALPQGYPITQNYVKPNHKAQIKSFSDTVNKYIVFFYSHDFAEALPPMALSNTSASSSKMKIDETFQLSGNNPIPFNKKGLYFIQHDTSTLIGRGIRVVDEHYPTVTTLESFAGPIRYISTNEEWNRIKKSNFNKSDLDKFWLNLATSENKARQMIRSYYHYVEVANKLFTSYKEGWKTDKGMIYILYGPPAQVYITEDEEEWIYPQQGEKSEIKFTFVRIKNPFDNQHFNLVRQKEYTKVHYQSVSEWRRGKKILDINQTTN